MGAAESAGRDPAEIEMSATLERPLPESDEDSERLVAELTGFIDLGITNLVMDFGHPPTPEPVLRFVEQVMSPLRAG